MQQNTQSVSIVVSVMEILLLKPDWKEQEDEQYNSTVLKIIPPLQDLFIYIDNLSIFVTSPTKGHFPLRPPIHVWRFYRSLQWLTSVRYRAEPDRTIKKNVPYLLIEYMQII